VGDKRFSKVYRTFQESMQDSVRSQGVLKSTFFVKNENKNTTLKIVGHKCECVANILKKQMSIEQGTNTQQLN